jgi:hypothetical protein
VAARLKRAKVGNTNGDLVNVITIFNESTKEESINKVVGALECRLSYALWLVPEINSCFGTWAEKQIHRLATVAAPPAHPFLAHVILVGPFICSQPDR